MCHVLCCRSFFHIDIKHAAISCFHGPDLILLYLIQSGVPKAQVKWSKASLTLGLQIPSQSFHWTPVELWRFTGFLFGSSAHEEGYGHLPPSQRNNKFFVHVYVPGSSKWECFMGEVLLFLYFAHNMLQHRRWVYKLKKLDTQTHSSNERWDNYSDPEQHQPPTPTLLDAVSLLLLKRLCHEL